MSKTLILADCLKKVGTIIQEICIKLKNRENIHKYAKHIVKDLITSIGTLTDAMQKTENYPAF